MKTSELTGVALDWAVAQAQGAGAALVLTHSRGQVLLLSDHTVDSDAGDHYQPTINWKQGGAIIEREKITLQASDDGMWVALPFDAKFSEETYQLGDTPLIAAMRCYVASKLGNDVNVQLG